MKNFLFAILVFCAWPASGLLAQTCTHPGQNPGTAFPVCGTGTFIQQSVNLCGGRSVVNPGCSSGVLRDVNPYWYKFTCYESGTLGFTITPNSGDSDYDWQLYDITGANPNDVFTNPRLTIAANWSQYPGETGTRASAASLIECEGPRPKYSKLPQITAGREYLLLVSHFTNTQAGYKLEFKGGTAVITDTAKTRLRGLQAACSGQELYLKLSKRVKCNSLSDDGSEFLLGGTSATVVAAEGFGCGSGFDFDSVKLTLSEPLPPGTYSIITQEGGDGNTLLDACDTQMETGLTMNVTVQQASHSEMVHIMETGCAPNYLDVVMSFPVDCNSIADDGSDFILSGPDNISISGIDKTSCQNDLMTTIRLRLDKPIQTAGIYTLTLQTGSDGNTLVNACALATPAGDTLQVVGYDSVSVAVIASPVSGCDADTVLFHLPGYNAATQYTWVFDNVRESNLPPSFQRVYPQPGRYTYGIIATNGVCTDSAMNGEFLFERIPVKAGFKFSEFACPGDSVVFMDNSSGDPVAWEWNFGNGQGSLESNPPAQVYLANAIPNSVQEIPVRLRVMNATGCTSDTTATVKIPNTCYIAVPTGFTPNGDGLNDYLYPLNAWKAKDLKFRVFDRFGQIVWDTSDWTRKWDGTLNGTPLPTGTFVWFLEYTDAVNGQHVVLKGTTTLIR